MSQAVERYDEIQKASELWLKGNNYSQIARELQISPVHAKALVDDYKQLIARQADDDPDFLNRLQENTLRVLDEIALVSKEAWETYDYAKKAEMVNQQVNALKLAKETTETRAKLLNLLGVSSDGSNMAQMRKLERVNEIVSNIIKEIVAECVHCRTEAQIRLAEAFSLMDRAEEATELRELNDDYVLAEIVEPDDFDHDAMHAQIVGE